MEKEFRIKNQKYLIGGPNNDSIAIPVEISNIPEELELEGNKLVRKPSFHVTLVPVGNISDRNGIDEKNFFEKLLLDFKTLGEKKPITFKNFSEEFRFVELRDRKTIIVMCEVSNLDDFYKAINNKYGYHIETPPTHVTLYTLEGGPGIFLIDSQDIEKLTRKIQNPGISLT